jgi:SAM-dependent methyltransferase
VKDNQDAFGHLLYDYLELQQGVEIVEREDGWIRTSAGPSAYFAEYADWPLHQQQAIQYAVGKVLDIGCGAGRHSLYLQQQGFDVLGVDMSPLAIEVCQRRGLKQAQVRSITQVSANLGLFDTILMLGSNFGLMGNSKRARWLLQRFHTMTSQQARLIVESNDIYQTTDPDHLAYQEFNRQRSRMPGQIRMRIRYKKYVMPWFDYLMVSKDEMKAILADTGWEVKQFIDSEKTVYVAILEKQAMAI